MASTAPTIKRRLRARCSPVVECQDQRCHQCQPADVGHETTSHHGDQIGGEAGFSLYLAAGELDFLADQEGHVLAQLAKQLADVRSWSSSGIAASPEPWPENGWS